ncbi:MAG: type II toxin-antitoxin system Phd/YefM family antitoxin, partial [Chloroflexota bacterium]
RRRAIRIASAAGPPHFDEVASRSYFAPMRAVGLKVLKNRLSEYVRMAASGETILVTDRERVVAELVPPRTGRAMTPPDAVLAEAIRKGWLTPALGATSDVIPRQPVTKIATLLEEIDQDRAEE